MSPAAKRRQAGASGQPDHHLIGCHPFKSIIQLHRTLGALLLLGHLAIMFKAQECGAQEQQRHHQVDYYVHLGKLGAIRGVRLAADSDSPVVGFLGLPYAAPPLGPLRLMPPGAHASKTMSAADQSDQREQSLLMPGARAALVRPQSQFGRRCVHLADWLEPDEPRPANSTGAGESGATRARQARARSEQSEDCLNLNVFVPLQAHHLNFARKQQERQQQQQQQQANDTGGKLGDNRNSINQEAERKTNASSARHLLWPLQQQHQTNTPLPVVVLVHGDRLSHQANTFAHLPLAQALNSVVVTFNYRIGLLGFLPSSEQPLTMAVMAPVSQSNSTGNNIVASALPSGAAPTRNNHALWDQMGLLHWLRRNAPAFGADPRNVTLMAADNHASLYVQLLALSPLTRGLFSRIVIVQHEELPDGEPGGGQLNLDRLLRFANESRDARRRLAVHSGHIVQKLTNFSDLPDEFKISQFIQLEANLSQLAQFERELEALHSDNLLAIALNPTLDDKLLFPHLASLIRRQPSAVDLNGGFANYTRKLMQTSYCLYVAQLYSSGQDPVNLIGLKGTSQLQEMSQASSERNETASGSNYATKFARPMPPSLLASELFDHLWNTFKLNEFVVGLPTDGLQRARARVGRRQDESSMLNGADGNDEEDDDDEEEASFWSRKQQLDQGKLMHQSQPASLRKTTGEPTVLRRKRGAVQSFGDRPKGGDFKQLLDTLSSFDLLVVFVQSPSSTSTASESSMVVKQTNFQRAKYPKTSGSFANIQQAITNLTRISQLSNHQQPLISLLKFADLHSVASWTSDEEILSDLCDFSSNRIFNHVIPTPAKSTHALLLDSRQTRGGDHANWLLDSIQDAQLAQKYSEFARLPNRPEPKPAISANHKPAIDWRLYNPLSREILRFNSAANSSEEILSSTPIDSLASNLIWKAGNQLDLLPYLSRLSMTDETQRELKTKPFSESFSSIHTCLNELDSSLGEFPLVQNELDAELQNVARIQEDGKCLSSGLAKLRVRLRQVAASDLEALLLRLQKYSQQQQKQLELAARSSASTSGDSVNGSALVEFNGIANQIDSESTSSNNSMILVARDSSQRATAQRGATGSDSTATGFRGFFAKTYKDAMGKALAIVVGTGLFIFLLNLLIVLIITLRSAQNGRRNARRLAQRNLSLEDGGNNGAAARAMGPTMKPTLKKPNGLAANGAGYYLANSEAETQLASVVASHSSSTLTANGPQKRLKFDLSGVPNHRGHNQEDDDDDDDEDDTSRDCNVVQQQQQQHGMQHQIVVMENMGLGDDVDGAGNKPGELVLSAPELMSISGLYATNDKLPVDNQAYQSFLVNQMSQPMENCNTIADLGSPFASISTNSSSNANAMSSRLASTGNSNAHNNNNHHHHHHHECANAASIGRQNPVALFHGSHSATSPGSSTSHSMTPIQLESFVAPNGNTATNTTSELTPPAGQQQAYQIVDPSTGLLYASELAHFVQLVDNHHQDNQLHQHQYFVHRQ